METIEQGAEVDQNLADLRTGSLTAITLFTGAVGYIWLAWNLWVVLMNTAPVPWALAGSSLLVLNAGLAYALRSRCPQLASGLVVGAAMMAAAGALLTARSPEPAFLFIIPVVFTNVLLGQSAFSLVAACAVLVYKTAHTVRSLVEGHGLTLQIEIDADLPYVWVDQTRIRQVLLNLLNNAVRFTDNGGITVRARQQGENVVIAVSDTGVGIAPEDIPIIFEEFRQVDGSTRRQQGGAGLGLAISRQLVELHGGRIWVESQVGQGSTFYFSLPAHIGHPDAPHDCLLAPPPEDAEARRDDRSVLLAVTRSATAAAWLSRYVRGWRTIVVSDLPQGCEAARQMMPELVIIDHDCREEGSCRLEELAAQWGLPRATFIECPLPSAEVQRGLAVDGYLIKPVARESLWDVLRRFGQNVDKLLVVDDDQDSVLLLGRMLEDNPLRRYQVINAYNGQEAVMKVRDHRPDLVLLDLGLPDMDGFEVIRRFRAEKGGEKVPVVIVSAQDDMLSQQTFRGGVTITKADGLSAAEILERIQEVADKAVIRGRGLAVAKAGRAR